MRVAVLVFFYGCATSGALWAVTGWAGRTVRRHVTRALDPRIDRGLELAAGCVPSGNNIPARNTPWAAGRPGQGEGLFFFAQYHDVLTEAERITREAAE